MTTRIDGQLRIRLGALASTLSAMAQRVADLFTTDADVAKVDADIRRLNRESTAYHRSIAASPANSDVRAIATFLSAAGDAAASTSSRYVMWADGRPSAESLAHGRIFADVTRRIERAVAGIDDPAALRQLVQEISELQRQGATAFAGAEGDRRWRSVHGRLALSIDRCGHAGRALERLAPAAN